MASNRDVGPLQSGAIDVGPLQSATTPAISVIPPRLKRTAAEEEAPGAGRRKFINFEDTFADHLIFASGPTNRQVYAPLIIGALLVIPPGRRRTVDLPIEEPDSGRRFPKHFEDLFAPHVISPPTIPQNRAVFNPIVQGDIQPATIAGGRLVFAPGVTVDQAISIAAAIAGGRTVFAPSLAPVLIIAPGTIAGGRTVYAPTIAGGIQFIASQTIRGGRQVFNPVVTGGTPDIYLFLAGVDRTAYFREADNVCTIDSQTMGRWQLNFDLYDATGTYAPALGMTVMLQDLGRRLFSGCISEITTDRFMSTDQATVYHITALDKSAICDRRTVLRQYLAADWADYTQVILDIVANYLNGEGIKTAGVPASLGPLGADLSFNFPSVTAAFDQIARDSGTVWWIDDDQLFFSPLLQLPAAPFALTETSGNWRNLTSKQSTAAYANKVRVVSNLNVLPGSSGSGGGGVGTTETFTLATGQLNVTLASTGGSLFLAQLFASTPIGSILSFTVNGHPQTFYDFLNGGYTGQTSTGPNDYVWAFGSGENVVQWAGPGNPVPPIGATIAIQYTPFQASQSTSIAQYGTALNPLAPGGAPLGTCGSGLFETVVQVQNLNDQEDLNAIALAYLARVGAVPMLANYQTDVPGLRPGQLQSVNVPKSGVPAGNLLVTKARGVYIAPAGALGQGGSFRWDIELNSNLDPGNDVFNWFARLVNRTNNLVPVLQYEDASFAIAPGGSVASALSITNPYPVKRTGLAVEFLWSWAVAPVNQDLIVTVTRNNSPIINAFLSQAIGPNQNTTQAIPATNQLYLYTGDIINISVSYSITGPNPTPASSVTFVVRWAM